MRNYIKKNEEITHLISTHETKDGEYETVVFPAYYRNFLDKKFIEVDWDLIEDKITFSKKWLQSIIHWWMVCKWTNKKEK